VFRLVRRRENILREPRENQQQQQQQQPAMRTNNKFNPHVMPGPEFKLT